MRKKFVDDIEFLLKMPEGLIRSFSRMVEAVIAAGATVVNIPDTAGYCLPNDFGAKSNIFFENVKNIDRGHYCRSLSQ